MNIVEIVGRLVRNPELKRVGDRGWPILSMNVAVDDATGRWNPDTRKTEIGSGFYQVEAHGPYAEEIVTWGLEQGDRIWMKGSLSQWRGKKDDGSEGEARTRLQVAVMASLNNKKSAHTSLAGPSAPAARQQENTGWDPSWPQEPGF